MCIVNPPPYGVPVYPSLPEAATFTLRTMNDRFFCLKCKVEVPGVQFQYTSEGKSHYTLTCHGTSEAKTVPVMALGVFTAPVIYPAFEQWNTPLFFCLQCEKLVDEAKPNPISDLSYTYALKCHGDTQESPRVTIVSSLIATVDGNPVVFACFWPLPCTGGNSTGPAEDVGKTGEPQEPPVRVDLNVEMSSDDFARYSNGLESFVEKDGYNVLNVTTRTVDPGLARRAEVVKRAVEAMVVAGRAAGLDVGDTVGIAGTLGR